jgi:hypothetical protein
MADSHLQLLYTVTTHGGITHLLLTAKEREKCFLPPPLPHPPHRVFVSLLSGTGGFDMKAVIMMLISPVNSMYISVISPPRRKDVLEENPGPIPSSSILRPLIDFLMSFHNRLNIELDLQSIFGLHVHSCTHWLRLRNPPPPPSPCIWAHIRGRYWSANIDDIS